MGLVFVGLTVLVLLLVLVASVYFLPRTLEAEDHSEHGADGEDGTQDSHPS